METILAIFWEPFVAMVEDPVFLGEVVITGLLTGTMYALVALGFVLIFKASGVFNFAQGIMVLFAALTLVGLLELFGYDGTSVSAEILPWYLIVIAVILTIVVMIALAFGIERFVLRPMINQDLIILFMATIGLTFFLEGFGEIVWGADVKKLEIGMPTGYWEPGGMLIQKFQVTAAAVAAIMVISLAVFFQKTRVGRALRAVADDHQAAQSVGIPLRNIWIVVWAVAGVVALVAGIMWSESGVQFSLSLIALKALPVLILGGFTSVPGAIVGGLIIGVGENIAEIYWGQPNNLAATQNWFAYMLALVFLIFRPQGLFGERIIERV